VDLKVIGVGVRMRDWNCLSENWNQWRTLVGEALNLRLLRNVGDILAVLLFSPQEGFCYLQFVCHIIQFCRCRILYSCFTATKTNLNVILPSTYWSSSIWEISPPKFCLNLTVSTMSTIRVKFRAHRNTLEFITL
jgi:hypothetical protein